jgi:hypothetical protein
MKIISVLMSGALLVGTAGFAAAQSDNHAAPGVPAPYAERIHANGEVSPAPVDRANGGVGSTEQNDGKAQTRSGGPVGGLGVNH